VLFYLPILIRLAWVLCLSALMTHCGKTNFDKSNPATGTAVVKSDVQSRDLDYTDPEETIASEPVSVGGAFLSCTLATALATATEAAIQCEFSSKGHDSARAQDLAYKFGTGSSRALASPILPRDQEFKTDVERQLWIWTFYFVREEIRDSWLFVDIQDSVRPLDPTISIDLAVIASTETVTPAVASAPAMFQFNSGPQKLGDDGAGVGVEAGCGNTDKPGIPSSRSRSYSVTVSVETGLTVVFSNLCGVGTGQTNTAGSFSTVSLRNANNVQIFQFNLANQTKLTYASSKLTPGVYTLIIVPASRNNALNDFVFSDLLIEGAGIAVQ